MSKHECSVISDQKQFGYVIVFAPLYGARMRLSKNPLLHIVCLSLILSSLGCSRKKPATSAVSTPAPNADSVIKPAPNADSVTAPPPSEEQVSSEVSQEPAVVKPAEEPRVAEGESIENRGMGTFSSGDSTCIFRRYAVGTGHVIEDIVTLPVACPKSWSMAITKDNSQALLHANGFWLVNLEEHTAQSLKTESGPAHGHAVWKEGLPTVIYETEPLTEEDVLMANEYEAYSGLPLLFCQESVFKDGKWSLVGESFTVESSEGYEPDCPAVDQDSQQEINNHTSQFDASCDPITDASVIEGIRTFLDTDASMTEWCWAASGEGGTIAVGYVWNEGMHLTGQIAGWTQQKWVSLQHLNGPIKDIAQLVTGTYICTEEGYGMFNSDDATNTYWREAPCLGLEIP